jgi:hypothetical protein
VFQIFRRAFYDSFLVFETGLKAVSLTVLGALVTALIVLIIRGWDGLKKHAVENIFIVFGGAVATWLLVFAWVLIHIPTKMLAEVDTNIKTVIQEKRQQSVTINSLRERIKDMEQSGPRVVTRTLSAAGQEKRCWVSNHFGFANSTIKGAVTATAVILRCNYKIEAPFVIRVLFDRDFIPGATTLPDSGGFVGGVVTKQGRACVVQFNTPALLSNPLAVMTVYGETDQYPRALQEGIQALN